MILLDPDRPLHIDWSSLVMSECLELAGRQTCCGGVDRPRRALVSMMGCGTDGPVRQRAIR